MWKKDIPVTPMPDGSPRTQVVQVGKGIKHSTHTYHAEASTQTNNSKLKWIRSQKYAKSINRPI